LLIKGSQSSLAHLNNSPTLLQDLGIRKGLAVFAGRLAADQARNNEDTKNAG
jgi:hypothetical protein